MKKTIVLDTKFGDVTGDGIYDKVSLVGNYLDNNSHAVENLKIIIVEGKSHLTHEIPIKNIIGYQPSLFLYPFRNKDISDIFISIVSGGSGGFSYCYIFGYDNTYFKNLFNSSMFDNFFKYKVSYLDKYMVEIINNTLKKKFVLDINYKGKQYLDDLYNQNGTLKKTVTGDVLGLNQLFPIDINNDGIFELLIFQRAIGLYNADLLGYLQTVLSWQKNQFNIFYEEQFFAQLGSDFSS
ncbi:MAG: VCBS repeat-containing protein [Bacilli bacterium]|nr:VCBS repeat-containing protein [Bacilli bacterium]MDD4719008.1 VCBS repeat-containing protein [Bacilli bacterium]